LGKKQVCISFSHLSDAHCLPIKIKELYPDIFSDEDSDKRVAIAVKIAMHKHNAKRRHLKQKGQLPPQKKAGNPAFKSVRE